LNEHIYQIYYDERTRGQLDPGFVPLDNLANARPDWREYWPIRRFLLSETLVEDHRYGFLSPRFKNKTDLSSDDVKEFVAQSGSETDVVIFSPFFDMSALFLNVFEQGDFFIPGFLETAQEFVNWLGLKISVEGLITDSRNTVFCNYLVAKPRFWRAWLDVAEKLYQVAEAPSEHPELNRRLNQAIKRRNEAVQVKVFVLERLASLILATTKTFATKACPPCGLTRSRAEGYTVALDSVICDALKTSFIEQGNALYREAFARVRQRALDSMRARWTRGA